MNTSDFSEIKKVNLTNGETYAYREKAAADTSKPTKTMLFLHATLCSSKMLDTGDFLEELVKAFPHHRFLATDFRGNGNSSYNTKLDNNAQIADDIKLFLDALKIDKVDLVGTCLGGYVSGVFCIRYPERVDNCILIGAVTHLGAAHLFTKENFPKTAKDIDNFPHFQYLQPNIDSHNLKELKPIMGGFHPNTWIIAKNFDALLDEIAMCKNLREVFYGEAYGNYSSRNNGYTDGNKDVEKFKSRLLIIHGEEDKTVPVEHARQMAQDVKGTTIHTLPGVGHFTWYDDLTTTVKLMKEFLA